MRKSVLTPYELQQMDYPELLKAAIRQANKYNRQISRAKKYGYSEELIYVGGDTRVSTAQIKKIQSAEELRLHYAAVEKRFKGGATKENLQNLREEMLTNLADMYDSVGGHDIYEHLKKVWSRAGLDKKQDIIGSYRKILDKHKNIRDAYYEVLKDLVYTKKIPSWSPDDRKGTPLDYDSKSIDEIQNLLTYLESQLDDSEITAT